MLAFYNLYRLVLQTIKMDSFLHLSSGFYVTDPSLRSLRRRSSASERAKEIEAINCIVSGKNVLITGAAAGLGYAFLNHFLKHGANVSLIIKVITRVTLYNAKNLSLHI